MAYGFAGLVNWSGVDTSRFLSKMGVALCSQDESFEITCNSDSYSVVYTSGISIAKTAYGDHSVTLASAETAISVVSLLKEQQTPNFKALQGSYSVALWSEGEKTLRLLRDFPGQRPMYYLALDFGLAFSTDVSALLAILPNPVIRTERVLDMLNGISEACSIEDTFYHGISRLKPGCTLEVSRKKRQVIEHRSPKLIEVPELSSNAHIVEFKHQLMTVLDKQKLQTKSVALALSGGIDSSALYAALDNLDLSFSGVSGILPAQDDVESRAIVDVQKYYLENEFSMITPDQAANRISSIEKAVDLINDPNDLMMLPLVDTLHAQAAANGATVLLNGVDGDIASSHIDEAGIRSLLLSSDLINGISAANYKASTPREMFSLLIRSIALPLLPVYRAKRMERNQVNEINRVNEGLNNGALSPELIDRFSLAKRMVSVQPKGSTNSHHSSHLEAVRHPNLTVGVERYWRSANRQGINSYSPLADVNFLEYCAALPASMKFSRGQSKWVLRQAFRKALPDTVVNRPRISGDHLSYRFVDAVGKKHSDELYNHISAQKKKLEYLFRKEFVANVLSSSNDSSGHSGSLYALGSLAAWLGQQAARLS